MTSKGLQMSQCAHVFITMFQTHGTCLHIELQVITERKRASISCVYKAQGHIRKVGNVDTLSHIIEQIQQKVPIKTNASLSGRLHKFVSPIMQLSKHFVRKLLLTGGRRGNPLILPRPFSSGSQKLNTRAFICGIVFLYY